MAKKGDKKKEKKRFATHKNKAANQVKFSNSTDKAIKEYLDCIGCYLVDIEADGNCLFRALSDQLYGGQHLHQLIRRRVVDYIIEKRCLFEPFLEATESFDHYVERMRQDGVWGGNQEIFAASQYFDADILIHQSASVPMLIEYDGRPQRLVHLYFSDSEHYDSIRALGDIETSSPPKRINLSLDGFRTEDFEARWRKRQKDRIETAKAHKTSPSVISVMPIKSGDQDVDQITSSLRKTVRFRDILPPTIATSRKELRQKKKELIRERCP